jgi:hypothetical protein
MPAMNVLQDVSNNARGCGGECLYGVAQLFHEIISAMHCVSSP